MASNSKDGPTGSTLGNAGDVYHSSKGSGVNQPSTLFWVVPDDNTITVVAKGKHKKNKDNEYQIGWTAPKVSVGYGSDRVKTVILNDTVQVATAARRDVLGLTLIS